MKLELEAEASHFEDGLFHRGLPLFQPPLSLQSPMMYSDQLSQDVLMIIKFLSNSPVIHVSAHTHPNVPYPAIVTAAANQTFAMNKWNNQVATAGRNAGVFSGLTLSLFLLISFGNRECHCLNLCGALL